MKEWDSWPVGTFARKMMYDWDAILNGKVNEIVQTEDFKIQCESMVNAVYREARRRGIKVKAAIKRGEGDEPDSVFVQALGPARPS